MLSCNGHDGGFESRAGELRIVHHEGEVFVRFDQPVKVSVAGDYLLRITRKSFRVSDRRQPRNDRRWEAWRINLKDAQDLLGRVIGLGVVEKQVRCGKQVGCGPFSKIVEMVAS